MILHILFQPPDIDKLEITGQSPVGKIAQIREEMQKKNAKAVVVTLLDEVAWLFNLHGSDIDYNPGARSSSWIHFDLCSRDLQYFSRMQS